MLGDRIPQRIRETATWGVGLITLIVGFQMAQVTHNILVTLVSVVLGGALGEWWRISEGLDALGRWVERRVQRSDGEERRAGGQVGRAFVTASLIFCVGPMTVIGSITDGLRGDYQLLSIKSLLDGITSVALAATLGWGVILSGLTVLIIQGGISLSSALAGQSLIGLIQGRTIFAGEVALPLGAVMLDEMTAAGGVLIVGLGLLLLDIRRIRVASFLPAIAVAPMLVVILSVLGAPIAP
ncbi:MAG: hypothetical protein KatS3mg057_1859 [Herpetosiphonaceae bacterium]|nr:MAG: hypothetical protein KatS3mg057_1859 [Herpetosiphonaceae bacterium]